MTRRSNEPFFSTGTLVVAAIAIVAVVAAWQVGKSSEKRAGEARARQLEEAARRPTAAAPAPVGELDRATESSATYEVPIEPPAEDVVPPGVGDAAAPPDAAPTPYPTTVPFATPEPRVDTAERCLTFEASPSMASAYGRSGEVVQLVVRARNGCATRFEPARFRAVALGPDGREVGSANGSFPGGVPASGSAETLVAIPTKPGTGLSFRAEVR